MNRVIRWFKFSLVGALGIAVQLAVLAALHRFVPGRYLLASDASVELTLLHNFVWHMHYTWRDQRDKCALRTQLLRFHLTNGLVSMTGNLALMRVLVRAAHMRVLVANCMAILCCSVVNFFLSDGWTFAGGPPG